MSVYEREKERENECKRKKGAGLAFTNSACTCDMCELTATGYIWVAGKYLSTCLTNILPLPAL